MATKTLTDHQCYHCGTAINKLIYKLDGNFFCCIGCQSVYKVLNSNNLCSYYAYNDSPGQAQSFTKQRYDYLEEQAIISKLVDYSDETITTITFYIPTIHCSSCIWLLEHLYKLNEAIIYSRIDFLKKQVSIGFKHQQVSLRKVVELLASVGYEPLISLQDVVKEKQSSVNRDLIKKIAVAGFCMGNVMLLSFPEYLGLSSVEMQFKALFGWLNLAFAIPVTLYSGRDFFISAWAGLKQKMINLDAPLALIITVLFLRSAFEVITATGPGFTDTLTGLVFLLLMGKWVKQRTYSHLSFERDYRSYFPVAVTALRNGKEKPLPLEDIVVGDRILIRNNEIIPADGILMSGEGRIDFSFVTGEAIPIKKVLGEIIFSGGRQTGEAIELEVIKPVSQSYLANLWNNEAFKQKGSNYQNFNDTIAKYFSLVTFVIAFSAAGFWLYTSDSNKAWNAFTAVLIVACPCVLSLSTPFTLSAVLTLFDKKRFYLKNTDAVEQLAKADTIVFDKTGTITSPEKTQLSFSGQLSEEEIVLVVSLARNSSHPLSREIVKWFHINWYTLVSDYQEKPGKGISGTVNGHTLRLGSSEYILPSNQFKNNSAEVHLEIDGYYKGYFSLKQQWRAGLNDLIKSLASKFDLHLLSGDNESDQKNLSGFFPSPKQMHFRQSPQHKLNYIRGLQSKGRQVIMLGDGLNDAGALKQSDMGVAVTDNINNFNPACDAILDGNSLEYLPQFIAQVKDAVKTIKRSLIISASYNLAGIYFAVQGLLSPLTAAVLMPLSTVTILIFTSISTRYFASKNQLL